MGFDLKPWEGSLHVIKSSSNNPQKGRGSLDASRKYCSQWFFPYPWKELKLSEFPNLATYAQGFPTNIPFSEGVGFLTANTPEIHFAFEITAHEAAHQWWGNILAPGKGPGETFSPRAWHISRRSSWSIRRRAPPPASTSVSGSRQTTPRAGGPTPSDPWSRSMAAAVATPPSCTTRGAGSSGCC